MGVIVQKYGGTSVANIERIGNIARRITRAHDDGNKLVVVLSAMAGVTDNLISMAGEITDEPDKQELDVLLATGEQTTAALLAIMLKNMNYPARSLLGYQAEVITNDSHGEARIVTIGSQRIKEYQVH